jgi:thiol-disulfide isomerase/thioredoxin
MYKINYFKIKQSGGSEKMLALFKNDNCPHCVNFKPEWKKITKELDKKKIRHAVYDSYENKDIFKKYDIDGIPSLLLFKGENTYQYVGDRSKNSVLNFVNNF